MAKNVFSNDRKGVQCTRYCFSKLSGLIQRAVPVDRKLEQRICRKLDFRLLPMLALMYLFNSLDKSNVSNAKTNGLEVDIGILGTEWNSMLSIFYVPYIVLSFPIMYLIRRYKPANVLPALMFGFGVVTMLEATVFDYGSLLACRWFLGTFEGAFYPGVIYYLTTFYRRDEMARRLSVFYAAMSIANAFSGLLAYGVFQITTGILKGWQYLFLIEGALTVLMSVISFIYLPREVETCKFLTEEERACAVWRIETDSSTAKNQETSIKDALPILKLPFTYLFCLQEVCLGVPIYAVNNWFPQIIANLGEGAVKTNLFTVAPNAWGAVSLLILAFSSDFARIRCVFVMIAAAVSMIGFCVFSTLDVSTQKGASYFCTFLMTSGTSASSVLTAVWYSNNVPNHNQRALMTVFASFFGNGAALIATNIFFPSDAPKYDTALIITACMAAMTFLCAGVNGASMWALNKRKDKRAGVKVTFKDVATGELANGVFDEKFRWMY